jgi:hypothetical protein
MLRPHMDVWTYGWNRPVTSSPLRMSGIGGNEIQKSENPYCIAFVFLLKYKIVR